MYDTRDKAVEGSPSSLGYLERYYDPAADLPARGIAEWEASQVERLSEALAPVIVAGSIVRRLGPDATREEWALDKKRAKRVAHAMRSSLFAWQKKAPKLPAGPEVQQIGAQINWELFVPEHISVARDCLIKMSTFAIQSQEHRWGRTVVTRIENEIKWLEYAMRD